MYVYVRTHHGYLFYNPEPGRVVKMGIATYLKDRDSSYATSEVRRGIFEKIFEIHNIERPELLRIESMLHVLFAKFHVKDNGGSEFFLPDIIERIAPILHDKGYSFTELADMTGMEHSPDFLQEKREREILMEEELAKIASKEIIPSNHQKEILENVFEFYRENRIGKLIWSCGLGKALLSILISKKINARTSLVGVPSKYLQTQFQSEILRVFPIPENILLVGGSGTTDGRIIRKFLLRPCENLFIITTYHSCHLLANFSFHFKTGDEAHHLVGDFKVDPDSKTFVKFHDIHAENTLFMTATEKTTTDARCYSMDDETYFGKDIGERKSVFWAIENKKITDYDVVVIKNTDEEIEEIIKEISLDPKLINTELFIAAYMTLKSIEKYPERVSHVLIYTNTIASANLTAEYIDMFLSSRLFSLSLLNEDNLYNKALCSDSCECLETEIERFKQSSFGIISCVYIFGEGVDIPRLNGTCFAQNMGSEVRIVQSAMRPNRLDANFPEKRAMCILPYIENEDYFYNMNGSNSGSFEKIRKIISKLGKEDKNIEQRIKVYRGIKRERKAIEPIITPRVEWSISDELSSDSIALKLKLKYRRDLACDFSEEELEYSMAVQQNKELNILSIQEYFEKVSRDDPLEYFRKRGVWRDWYHFMGIDCSSFLSKSEWVTFCNLHSVKIHDAIYTELCFKHPDKLPRNPEEFYKNFIGFSQELGSREIKKRR
jgi:superfamily II DNA or RNA helicase